MNPLQKKAPETVNARRLMWWSERQLATLEALLEKAREKWLAVWVDDFQQNSISMPKISCRAAHECDGAAVRTANANWRPLVQSSGVDDESQVWFDVGHSDELMAQFLLKSSSSIKPSRLLEQLCDEAFADFLAGIKTALELPHGERSVLQRRSPKSVEIPASHQRPWSGAVRIVFSLDEQLSFILHLGPARVAALMKTAGSVSRKPTLSVASLNEALAGHAARLRVELTPVDISVGNLASLTVGDVLVLPHLLTQTLHVRTEDGQSFCDGYLGQLQGQRAIELIKPVAPVH